MEGLTIKNTSNKKPQEHVDLSWQYQKQEQNEAKLNVERKTRWKC